MRIRILILIVLLTACFYGEAFAANPNDSLTIYLVRHAEKEQDGSRDPGLTATGLKRSQNLARWFIDKNIKDIWSSDYKRTRDTAAPTLSSLELDLTLYDPRDLPALTEKLLAKQHNALVVGHSDTTPQLARLLCQCEIADMDESEYDRVIVISISHGETQLKTLQQN